MLDFVCSLRLHMAWLPFNYLHIFHNQVDDSSQPCLCTRSPPLPRALHQIHTSVHFTSTHFLYWLLCNGTSYRLTLLYCPHCLSSVWQSSILTTSHPGHNRPVFNLFLNSSVLIFNTFTFFHLTIALFILTLHLLLFHSELFGQFRES